MKKVASSEMSPPYWCCLHKFASAAAISTWQSEAQMVLKPLCWEGQNFVQLFSHSKYRRRWHTVCSSLSLRSQPVCLVFLRLFTSDHSTFIIGKSFSRKYWSLFSHAHTKIQLLATALPVIAVVFPSKTTISIHLPSFLTGKQTVYSCEGQENLDTFTSEAHYHLLVSTQSTPSFPLQASTEMKQWRLFYDGSSAWNAGAQINHLRLIHANLFQLTES